MTAARKQDPVWAMWLGPLLGVIAIVLKASGQGIARGMVVFCIVSPVLIFRLWDRVPPARRPLLIYAPAALAAVVVVTFFVIPVGGPSGSDDEITPGVCRYGYTQQGDCLPASGVVPGSSPNDVGPGDCPNAEGRDSHGYVCPSPVAPGDD